MVPEHGETIKKLGYIPVGLGKKSFPNYFLSDKSGDNISEKNPFYGEYTFHYWLWRNKSEIFKSSDWIGLEIFFSSLAHSPKSMSLHFFEQKGLYSLELSMLTFFSQFGQLIIVCKN